MRIALLVLSLTAPAIASAQVTRTMLGDTLIISTTGNGSWGAPRAAVELLRVGGGPAKELSFSKPTSLTALPSGGVLFYDAKAIEGPIIRLFDASGKFLRNIGRNGAGPGEYNTLLDIEVDAKGGIWVADVGNSRMNRYSAEGKYLSQFRVPGSTWVEGMLTLGPSGGIYLAGLLAFEKGSKTLAMGYLHFDSLGAARDTISARTTRTRSSAWAIGLPYARVLTDGRAVVTMEKEVGILLAPSTPNARWTRSVLQVPRATYLPEERQRNQAAVARGARSGTFAGNTVQMAPPELLPEFKPPVHNVTTDVDGRIWVHRRMTATNSPGSTFSAEPIVFDAFAPDGSFLGEVTFPSTLAKPIQVSFVGEVAWAMVKGADDEVYLAKYRIR